MLRKLSFKNSFRKSRSDSKNAGDSWLGSPMQRPRIRTRARKKSESPSPSPPSTPTRKSNGLGTGDEYADPWDIRSGTSSPSQAGHGGNHPLYPSNKGGEESSYSAPFSVLTQHNNSSRPPSPKLSEVHGKTGANDDYQDPFDARLRQAASTVPSPGLHTDHHVPAPQQQQQRIPRGSVGGVARPSTTGSEYDTPADSLNKHHMGGGGGGMGDQQGNYSLPADMLRSAMAEHNAAAGGPACNYSTPRDTVMRPSTSDLGIVPISATNSTSSSATVGSDYSNPADHIGGDMHRQSPARPPRYSDFRMAEGTRTPSDSTSNHLVASSGSTSSNSRQQHVTAHHDYPDVPSHHGGVGQHHSAPIPYHAAPPPVQHHQAPLQQHHPAPAQHHGGLSQREALRTCKWFHGTITRDRAEMLLRAVPDCSFLVRVSESSPNDYSLSVRNSGHPLHLKINRRSDGTFVLGQNSKPFMSIIDMIQYYERHKLLIKGAEHIFLEYVIPR